MLQKDLFASYNFKPMLQRRNAASDEADDDPDGPTDDPLFRISLDSLLETLQIFGLAESQDRWTGRDPFYGGVTGTIARGGPSAPFDTRNLGMAAVCKLGYADHGSPLSIVIEEAGLTTTCELATYEADPFAAIPIQKDAIDVKIIMRASWLFDAVEELSTTKPTRLTIHASTAAPYFTLSATGAHGAASVEFSRDPQLLETFQVRQRWVNTYKFEYVKNAGRAMALASKVSLRGDMQGVLSLQFMVELEEGAVSFVDFRLIPYIAEDGDEEEDGGGDRVA